MTHSRLVSNLAILLALGACTLACGGGDGGDARGSAGVGGVPMGGAGSGGLEQTGGHSTASGGGTIGNGGASGTGSDTGGVAGDPASGEMGIPFGPYGLWDTATDIKSVGTDAFDMSTGSVTPTTLVKQLAAAQSKDIKMILAMTGGSHDNYMTNGVFDMSKWKAKMDLYDTPEIHAAVEAGVADGTILGNSVMDEPNVSGLGDGNTWGPAGTMTKAKVDDMCAYVKAKFPSLPVGVAHGHATFEPDNSYHVCEFIIDQYSNRMGDVNDYRDAGLALGQRDDIAILFSMNILNGGIQAKKDGTWNCPLTTTGGRGTYEPNCRMTPEQVSEYGKTLGAAGCAMTMWRYDDAFMADPDNQAAFDEVAALLRTKPRVACTKP
jgi:hypothetical protein